MELEQQKALKKYFDKGYIVSAHGLAGDNIILVKSKNFGPYVFKDEEIGHYAILKEIEYDGIGECTSISLGTVSISDVQVTVPIDWMGVLEINIYNINNHPLSGYFLNPNLLMSGHNVNLKQYIEDLNNAYDEAGD